MLITRIKINGKKRWLEKSGEEYFLLQGDPYKSVLKRKEKLNVADESNLLFTNFCKPKMVYGLAYNYKSLVGQERLSEEPLIFFKSVNSVTINEQYFIIREEYQKVWVECELVIIMKKNCKNITANQAGDYILGYTIGSDITAENIYRRDHHLAFSKGADNFAPIFNWFNTRMLKNKIISTKINNRIYQSDNTKNRLWNDYEAVSELSKYFSLKAGDLIFTGTPAGAMESVIKPGDRVVHFIQGLGKLKFMVK
jgi:2-keto-4-pentenoate hydratase/2-oxohepta-3-ene-1,7-dioic acid hydratase in catechol pathway